MGISFDTFLFLFPEAILVVTAAAIYVLGATGSSRVRWMPVTFSALLLAAWCAMWQPTDLTVGEAILVDGLGQGVRWVAILVGALFVIMSGREEGHQLTGEIFGSLLLIVVGTMLVGLAGDLVLLFLALELISIPTYVLLFLGSPGRASVEATTKYFFLSIFSSCMLLYGFSLLYGLAGSTSLAQIYGTLAAGQPAIGEVGQSLLTPLAFAMILAGIGFKIAAVPFHFYAPDVYQGTTSLNAGILAVFPKIAGMVALMRLILVMSPGLGFWSWQTVMLLSLLTMTLGNVAALWQTNIRRLLAYSSIAHTGYMLMGLAVALSGSRDVSADEGFSAMLLYLLVYAIASVGTFAALGWLSDSQRVVDRISSLAGTGFRRPAAAACVAIFMFSLAGIPPLAGFWGKFFLFWSTISLGLSASFSSTSFCFIILAVVGVLNAAIGMGYYLRIIAVMYFPAEEGEQKQIHSSPYWGSAVAMLICAALVLAVGIGPGRLMRETRDMARSAWIERAAEENSDAGVPISRSFTFTK